MIRLLLPAFALLLAPAVQAAERIYPVSSFDRVRIDGPFEVRLVAGGSPAAQVSADQQTLDRVALAVDGTTLTIRMNGQGWGERPAQRGGVPVVRLATPLVRTAIVNAGGQLVLVGVKGQRVDLSVSGSGAIVATGIVADQLTATVIGTGSMTLAGSAARTRLLANGPATIDAGALTASDLVVRLDGTGTVKAAARFTAHVTNTGLGSVSVAGDAACTVNRDAAGPVSCGRSQQP